ncbi:hypothetical protein IGI39_002479 [Enterococcus sp. AZ135]|uniref:hypothetical protein n=1 Tax=unclassified Enterococcus TaxID=2608891 RepID=UPI003F225357
MNTKIDTKRTELDHLKKELKTFERLSYANVPTALEAKRVEGKIKKLTKEITELKKS